MEIVQQWIHDLSPLPFTVFLYPTSSPKNIREDLLKLGFILKSTFDMVTYDTKLFSSHERYVFPKNLILKRVENLQDSDLFYKALTEIFDVPNFILEYITQWARSYGFDESNALQSYIMKYQESAIAIASFFKNGDFAMIQDIGVIKAYQNQRLGSLIIQETVRIARDQGCELIIGNGSIQGMKVYKKFGNTELGKTEKWVYGGRLSL